MRELNVCEVGVVAGGEGASFDAGLMSGQFGGNALGGSVSAGPASTLAQWAWNFVVNAAAGVAGNIAYSWLTSPPSSNTGGATGSWEYEYGNGNGATGGGYSGAGIGGNVASGSTGSSHFG